MDTLKCGRCKEVLPISRFTKDKSSRNGFSNSCKKCRKHIRRKCIYGLTEEAYNSLLRGQKWRCAICGIHYLKSVDYMGRGLHVDHDHDTGKIRGLLCSSCNRALGFMKDEVSIVQKAVDYLKRNR